MIDTLRKCLVEEAQALIEISNNLDDSFIEFAEEIAGCKGKVFLQESEKAIL